MPLDAFAPQTYIIIPPYSYPCHRLLAVDLERRGLATRCDGCERSHVVADPHWHWNT